jgi:hypothetical protein
MNVTITPTFVSKDTAMFWKLGVKLLNYVERGYGSEWQNSSDGAKKGYTIQQRIPTVPVVNEGQALQIQPMINQTVPISLTHQLQVACEWSTADDTVLIEEVQDRWTRPAGKAMAAKTDALLGREIYKAIYTTIGTPGTPITDNQTFLDGVAKMADMGAAGDLVGVLSPSAMAKLVGANFAIFNLPGGSKSMRTGQYSGEFFGIGDLTTDPFLPTHTTGTFTASTPVISGANQTGSTLTISGMGTYALKAGDTFKIAGVNAVNPVSHEDSGNLAEFSLQVDVAGSSTATLTFSPPIVLTGPLQSVVTGPANGAAITFTGSTGTVSATMAAVTSKQSLIFNPSAFAFVNAPLSRKLPGAETGQIRDAEAKVSMRYVEQYSITTDQLPRRIDMLVGNAAIQPYFAMRVWS